ncbi:MAG: glycosyltransferase family 1 protein [Bacteroidales bacterium]
MNIGFDAKRAFFNKSGLGNYSRSTVQLLSKYYPDNSYFLYTPKFSEANNEFIDSSNIHVRTPRQCFFRAFNPYWRSYRMACDFKYDDIDLFHGLSNELPMNIRKSNVKSVLTVHDLIFMRYPTLYKKVDRWIYEKKFKLSCQRANTVIAVSQQTKDDLIHYFKIEEDKIRVVYQGCNPIFYDAKTEAEKNKLKQKYNLPESFLLYVGTIEERKNALGIVKALHEGGIDIPLVLVGKPTAYKRRIEQYIADKNVKNDIRFFSEIPYEELPVFYQLSSAFIYPSFFEGFGIPILEALNSGVPVITSSGGCFHETGGPASMYVEPSSTEEIANAIRKVLFDDQLRQVMKEKGFAHAMKFRDGNVAKAMMQAYLDTFKK